MRASVVIKPGSAHHATWCGAMADGLRRHGVDVDVRSSAPGAEGDFAVCWGWRIGAELRRAGLDVLVMEAGHLPDRLSWASCAWNGLGRRGRYVAAQDSGERWTRLWGDVMQPWRHGGDYALVLGQVPSDTALEVMRQPFTAWAQQVTDRLRDQGHEVRYRSHPLMEGDPFCPQGARRTDGALDHDLGGAALAVTFNSTSGVEAVLAGVPTVTLDEGSMAWPVAGHSIDSEPVTPDRRDWCSDMAWAQFSIDEIASGVAWEYLEETRHAEKD